MKQKLSGFKNLLVKPIISAMIFLSVLMLWVIGIWGISSLESLKSDQNENKLTATMRNSMLDYIDVELAWQVSFDRSSLKSEKHNNQLTKEMWDTLIDNLGGIACYSCQGVAPDNATLCPEDNTELTANTNRTLVSSCGSAKCEYTCNAEYTLQNGACAKQETYTLMVYGGYDDENWTIPNSGYTHTWRAGEIKINIPVPWQPKGFHFTSRSKSWPWTLSSTTANPVNFTFGAGDASITANYEPNMVSNIWTSVSIELPWECHDHTPECPSGYSSIARWDLVNDFGLWYCDALRGHYRFNVCWKAVHSSVLVGGDCLTGSPLSYGGKDTLGRFGVTVYKWKVSVDGYCIQTSGTRSFTKQR